MRALVFDGTQLAVTDRPAPQATPGMAIVRPLLAGICNTDLELVAGYMNFSGVLGHELVGRVEQGPPRWVGKRVTCEINFACGDCEQCARALGRHCPNRSVMGILAQDGAFAEQVAVPVANLHEVPDAVANDEAVFTEPLAAAYEILEQVPVVSGMEAVVLGDGKLGLLVAQVLADAGAQVTAVGKHPSHLEILQERGIRTSLLADWDRTPRDLVVEATGTAAGFTLAAQATRPRGILLLKSTVAAKEPVDLAPLVINEIAVIGSRCGPFRPALRALEESRINTRSLIEASYGLDRAEEAFAHASKRGCLKVLLRP